jgi:predicted nucleic acid-binding protein
VTADRPGPPRPGLLLSAERVVFDTTFPRHLAVLGTPYLKILTQLFTGRAAIPQGVELELRQAAQRGWAPAAVALIGSYPILPTVQLTDEQFERAERLRSLLPVKTGKRSENLGEAQAIILAKDLGCPLVIDERDGTVAAVGRGVAAFSSAWVLILTALEGYHPDDDAWDIYCRVCAAGMGIPRESPWQPSASGEARFRQVLRDWRVARANAAAKSAPPPPSGRSVTRP